MSIRRRMAIVFLVVNAVSVALLLGYLSFESRRIEKLFTSERTKVDNRTARLLGLAFKSSIETELANALDGRGDAKLVRRADPLSLPIDIGKLDYWDEDRLVKEYLDRAVLIRYTENEGIQSFNPRPRFIFEEEEEFDPIRIKNLIQTTPGIVDSFDSAGRRIVYGTIDSRASQKSWGFYFRLKEPEPSSFDPAKTMRTLAWIIIPGTLFLLAFLFFTFRQSVLAPIRELEAAAIKTSQGDYETQVAFHERRDELGRVARAMNIMRAELLRYRQHMEGRVDDATERVRRAEQHLVVAQRLAAMGRLAAGVAHEVNNPLGGVLNAIKKLGRDDLSHERREKFLNLAEDGVKRIEVTVRRLLDTMPRGPKVDSVSLAMVVEKAQALSSHRMETEGVAFRADVASDLVVNGDAQELVQVFLNLFLNALDAMDGGGGAISVEAVEEGPVVEVRVKDDGVGMEEEVRAHIFDLFFTTKPGTEGTGLGLAVVHNIVTGHGGTISVESAPGQGTTFQITLPRPA